MYKEILLTIMILAVVALDAVMVNVAIRCMKEITKNVIDKLGEDKGER